MYAVFTYILRDSFDRLFVHSFLYLHFISFSFKTNWNLCPSQLTLMVFKPCKKCIGQMGDTYFNGYWLRLKGVSKDFVLHWLYWICTQYQVIKPWAVTVSILRPGLNRRFHWIVIWRKSTSRIFRNRFLLGSSQVRIFPLVFVCQFHFAMLKLMRAAYLLYVACAMRSDLEAGQPDLVITRQTDSTSGWVWQDTMTPSVVF